MPKFLLSVVFASLISFLGLFLLVKNTTPEEPKNVVVFFVLLWLFLTLLLSVPIYLVNFKRAARYSNLKQIFRSSLKISSVVSLLIVALGILKVLSALSILNFLLLLVFILLIYKL